MFTRLETGEKNFLAYRVEGKVTTEEYLSAIHVAEKLIEEYGKIKMLIEIDKMEFPETGVFWEDLRFISHNLNNILAFAAIGHKQWEKWWVKIVGSFIPPEARYFDISQKDEAWRWIRGF
jgi:hypothetical protein